MLLPTSRMCRGSSRTYSPRLWDVAPAAAMCLHSPISAPANVFRTCAEPGAGIEQLGAKQRRAGQPLLGCLARLTALAVLRVGNASPPLQVDWMPADGTGGGPALLSLKLLHCCIAAPSATAAGLEHLQSLRLVGVEGCGGLMEEMCHLRHLTTLTIETPTGADAKLWDAQMDGAMRLMAGALSLQSLLDLRLGRFQSVFSIADFEFEETAECLTAVTSLSLCYAAGPNLLPSAYCAAMTALRRLDVSGWANAYAFSAGK